MQAALDAMERMKSGDVPAEEIERAKQSVISSYVQDTTTFDGQISALFDIEQYGLGRDYILNFEARVAAVGSATARPLKGVKLAKYSLNDGDVSATHPFARRFDLECRRAEQVLQQKVIEQELAARVRWQEMV